MFAWFRARCNDQQLPPRWKFEKRSFTGQHSVQGINTRSAGFRKARSSRLRAGDWEVAIRLQAPVDGLEPSLVSLTGTSRPTDWATPDSQIQQSGWLDLNQRSRAPEARGFANETGQRPFRSLNTPD